MRENGKYRLLQSAYYAGQSLTLSYAAYYLGTAGFSDRTIGIIMAVTCALGSVFQGVVGRIADRSRIFHWKRQLQIYSILEILFSLLLLVNSGKVLCGLFYALLTYHSLLMMPMVNAASFYYTNLGKPVDFGIARGLGSLSFAVTSFIVGKMTASWGSVMVPYLNIVVSLAMYVITTTMPFIPVSGEKKADMPTARQPRKNLLRTYPVFFITVIGVTLLVFFNNVMSFYIIRLIEYKGGGSGDLGIALAIAATTELPVMFMYSRIARRISSARLIMISGFFFILRGILYIVAPNVQALFFVQLTQSVSFGLLAAAKSYYANNCMADEDKVTGQAVMTMTESIGSVIASLAGGLLIAGGGIMLVLWCITGAAVLGTLITGLTAMQKQEARQ